MESTTFPWLKHLPEDEQVECLREIKKVLSQGSGSWQFRLSTLDEAVTSWKATAGVYTDPEALKVLTTPLVEGDLVDVPSPAEMTLMRPAREILRAYLKEKYGDRLLLLGGSEPLARLLGCGLCYEEDGQVIHPHPECTWISARYRPGSVITQGVGPGSWRWEVVDVLEQDYRVRALSGPATSPGYSLWEFGLCHAATVLERQKDGREGVIGPDLISRVLGEEETGG